MDRYKKITEIKALEKLIKEKKEKISLEEIEIAKLETKLREAHNSEIPVLLFLIDETMPLPKDALDYRYEYIYYCPDIDEVKSIIEHTDNKFLPNTIDMRAFFEKEEMPKKIWPGKTLNQIDQLNYSILYFKTIINNLFASRDIDNWADLAHYLKTLPKDCIISKDNKNEVKRKNKVLRPNE